MSMDPQGGEPSEIALIRELVNTVEWQEDDESWSTIADLAAWMSERAMSASRLTTADLVGARRIREGLREVLLGHAGHQPRHFAIDDLNDALSGVSMTLMFEVDGGARVTANRNGGRYSLAPIVEAIEVARRHPGWSRLKACSRDTCRWAYWDASRNGSRRWCSMQGCGNYIKMRRRDQGEAVSDTIPAVGEAQRVTTLRDVAGSAGVSVKTVSNVVNGVGHVGESTRARVQKIIDELDYHPNLAARQLRTGVRPSTPGDETR
jgi:predicted RNA-binding Zn ribbon-like protein